MFQVSGDFIWFVVVSVAGWTGTPRRSSFYACAKRFERYSSLKKIFNHFLLLFHSYDADVCAFLRHTHLRHLWSEQKSGWNAIRQFLSVFSTVWIRCWRISVANALPSPRRCCFITCSQLSRTYVWSSPQRFFRALLCRGTVPFPDCPRSFNERRHCGVILPRALFVFLFEGTWILTNLYVGKVKSCKNAIFSFVGWKNSSVNERKCRSSVRK